MYKKVSKAFVLIFCFNAFAHPPSSPSSPGNRGDVSSSNFLSMPSYHGVSTGGYGFMCESGKCSEAQAIDRINLDCNKKDIQNYTQSICRNEEVVSIIKIRDFLDLNNVTEKIFLKTLRLKTYEYLKLSTMTNPKNLELSLNKKAASIGENSIIKNDGVPNEKLSCINDSDEFKKISDIPLTFTKENLDNPFYEETYFDVEMEKIDVGNTILKEKAAALANRFHPENIIRTLIYDKFLSENIRKYPKNSSMEKSILSQKKKMRQSYPGLFDEKGEFFPEAKSIMDTVYKGLGVSRNLICGGEINLSAAETDGKKIFSEKANAGSMLFPSIVDEFFENTDYLANRLDNTDECSGDALKNKTTKNLSYYFNSIDQNIKKLGERQLKKEQMEKSNICNLGIDDISKKYPQVVRQAMNDMGVDNLDVAKYALCSSGNATDFKEPVSCKGKRGNIKSPKGQDIIIDAGFFPYKIGGKINARELDDGTIVLKKTIRLEDKAGLTDKEKKCLSKSIENELVNDINCQIGYPGNKKKSEINSLDQSLCGATKPSKIERDCPTSPNKKRDPMVKIEVDLEFDPPFDFNATEDKISIYKCYRSEIPVVEDRSDCEKVKEWNISTCEKSNGIDYGLCFVEPPEKLKGCCTSFVADNMENGSLFRQNANNMTPFSKQGVWQHEIFHTFGLGDEYSDPTYPVADMGEHDSVMRNPYEPKSKILPRHVDSILKRVKECQ
jgi:hypothetical protein